MTTSGLLLPERFHQKNKRKTEEKETAKLPAPTGWRILIMPYTPPKPKYPKYRQPVDHGIDTIGDEHE